MKISELARRVGVSVETIRYYQRTGLIDVPGRPLFGFRSYTEAHAASLSFIRRAQRLGFTLDEVAALLHLSTSDCDSVESLARERLAAVDVRLRELRRLRKSIVDVLHRCERRKPDEGCPIIETLAASE